MEEELLPFIFPSPSACVSPAVRKIMDNIQLSPQYHFHFWHKGTIVLMSLCSSSLYRRAWEEPMPLYRILGAKENKILSKSLILILKIAVFILRFHCRRGVKKTRQATFCLSKCQIPILCSF